MDEQGLRRFLAKEKRSKTAINRCVAHVADFEAFLRETPGMELDHADAARLEAYADRLEEEKKGSAKTPLWALRYYFRFTGLPDLANLAGTLRESLIRRAPFKLRDFRGVDQRLIEKLSTAGIDDVAQMRDVGRTAGTRIALAERTGIPAEAILELVKLSDLARVAGLKSIRARLYYDAGVDTLDKLSSWDSEGLRARLTEYVEAAGFEGIPPTPKEAAGAVAQARKLPRIIEYEETPPDG